MLSEVISKPELDQLITYLNRHGGTSAAIHNHILDWLATQPTVLARMNRHQLLITYFAYLLEMFITTKPR